MGFNSGFKGLITLLICPFSVVLLNWWFFGQVLLDKPIPVAARSKT